jgi:hypothetical protein
MTIEEVRWARAFLQQRILDEAQKFTDTTGCLVELRVTYRRVNVDTCGERRPPTGYYESTVEITV